MSVIRRTIQINHDLRVFFTRDVFARTNLVLRNVLADPNAQSHKKALVVLDEALALAQPLLAKQIEDYFTDPAGGVELACPPIIIEGGERAKNSYVHVSEIHSGD